jgi:hypothetical protein
VCCSWATAPGQQLLGNSYTYFDSLPAIVMALAEAGTHRLEATMVAPGGWRLKDHLEKGEALSLLRSATWDFVVLQEQSTLGTNLFVDGKPRVAGDEAFQPWAEKWAIEITRAGATPVFYLTWARRASPEDQATLTHAYLRAARATRALVAPVGLAWARAQSMQPSLDLYAADGSHPSATGSYLAGCTFYATFFHSSPVGLPARVSGAPVNLDTGQVETGRTALLVDLTVDDARVLQEAAWDAVQAVKHGDHGRDVPPTPALAPLPGRTPLTPAALEGKWTGRLMFYPSGPADLTLELHAPAAACGSWRGHLQLELHFRGVLGSGGELIGAAEAVDEGRDPPLRLIGTWQLSRSSK